MNVNMHPLWTIFCGIIIVTVGFTLLLGLIGGVVDVVFGNMRIVPLPVRRPRREFDE